MAQPTIHLSPAELQDLTDRQLPSKQIAWLKENGWKFAISAAGRPKVARTYYDYKLGTREKEPDNDQEPDFSHWVNNNGGAQKKQSGNRHEPPVRLPRQAA